MDVLKKQALLVGTPRKALSPVQSYWESTATQRITDGVHIKNYWVSDRVKSQWPVFEGAGGLRGLQEILHASEAT